MIGRLAAQMLDPYFIREEELASIIQKKVDERNLVRRKVTRLIAGSGWAEITIPASYEWYVYSVTVNEPVDAGVGTVAKEHFLQFNDELNIPIFNLGIQQLPTPHAWSNVTWGIDLADMREDDGQGTPMYSITAPLPKMWLQENYRIYFQRDGVGGIPVTTSTWRIFYLEYRKVG